jgi:hypothetical protein
VQPMRKFGDGGLTTEQLLEANSVICHASPKGSTGVSLSILVLVLRLS